MTALVVIACLSLVTSAVWFLGLPAWSRRHVFFSVTVADRFREEPESRRILATYRLAVLAGTTLSVALVVLLDSREGKVAGSFAQLAVIGAAWVWARQRVLPHAVIPPPVRVATLQRRETRIPGGWPIAIGPFVILGATALLLGLNWDAIPARFPVRWDATGRPIGWATKSITSVFGPVTFGMAAVGVMIASAAGILHRSRQVTPAGAAATAEQRTKTGTARLSLVSAYCAASLFSFFATRKLVAGDQTLGPAVWVFLAVIVSLALAALAWSMRMGQGGDRAINDADRTVVGDGTPDRAWKAGLVYFNPDDPALFVEKRFGFGWTLNFANPWSWAILLMPLAPVAFFLLT